MNGWLLLRLLGISVGIITLVGFATDYLHVNFDPYVESVLKVLQEIAGLIVAAPLLEMLLDWLRQHFAWVPKPEAQWKPFYTLSALLMVSVARRMSWYTIPVAMMCAFVPAVLAGTKTFGSSAMAWLGAGLFAFVVIAQLLGELGQRVPMVAVFAALASVVFAAFGVFGSGYPMIAIDLVYVAGFIGVLGFMILLNGLIEAEGTFGQRLQDPRIATGLDVTATLGGALALGYLFAA